MRKRIKMKFLEALLASIVAVFAPISMAIVTTGVLVFVDLITGILAARKRGENINSGGLRRTTTKTLVYLSAICVGFLVERYMIYDFVAISKIVTGLIAATEFKSILENLDILNGTSVFKTAIEKLGSINDILKSNKKDDTK
jgi:hypothetical protein